MISKIKALFEKYPVLGEIFRFCLVGGIATVVDFLIMAVTLYLFHPELYETFWQVFFGGSGNPSLLANMVGTGLGFLVGLVVNYFLSVFFVFLHKGDSQTAKGFLQFAFLSAIGLGLHEVGMYLLNELLGVNEWIVKIVMTIIVLIYNYVSRKLIIFKEKPASLEEEKEQL